MPLSFGCSPAAKTSTKSPKEAMVAVVDPPHPAVELKVPYKTAQAWALRACAKDLKIEGDFVWQYDGRETWSTIHKESSPTAPRITCDPVQALQLTKTAFEQEPACYSFTIKTSDGNVLTIRDLERVEWTAVDDLAEESQPDRLDELEDQINELQSDKESILARLDTLEALVKSHGKRKAVVDDNDDAVEVDPATPAAASSSRMRRSRK